MLFPFLTIFLIAVIVMAIFRSMSTKQQQERQEKFWTREEEAEHTPPVDLTTLSYVHFPASGFHFAGEGEEAEAMEAELMELSQKPLLSLSGLTNTDVKLKYGTANFEKMQEIGENYDRLIMLLADYAKLLMQQGQTDAAIEVLEFGMEIGSDISSNYTLLGDCYESKGDVDKVRELAKKVEATDLLLKPKILTSLKENIARLTGEPLNDSPSDEDASPEGEPKKEEFDLSDQSSSENSTET